MKKLSQNNNIPISLIRDLRERTGASVASCKLSLVATMGNIEDAMRMILSQGLASSERNEKRVIRGGLIGAYIKGKIGSIIEVSSETDFVSLNEKFRDLVLKIAELAIITDGDLKNIKMATFSKEKETIQDKLDNFSSLVKEKITLRRSRILIAGQNEILSKYVHNTDRGDDNLGNIGALVILESYGNHDLALRFGKSIAMHIVASHDLIKREVIKEASENIQSRSRSINYKDDVEFLYRQTYLADNSCRTFLQVLKDMSKEVGNSVSLKNFVCFKVSKENYTS